MTRSRLQRDPNGTHARLYHETLKSPAWIALPSSAIRLYVDLRSKLNGGNNGNIEVVFNELRHRGWKSKTTLHKALRALQTLGFIALTRQGGIASMSKFCSLYRFTDLDTNKHPKQGVPAIKATHDYRQFTTLGHARAALREAETVHPKRVRKAGSKKAKVQKVYLISPETGFMNGVIGTETGHSQIGKVQKLYLSKEGASAPKSLSSLS